MPKARAAWLTLTVAGTAAACVVLRRVVLRDRFLIRLDEAVRTITDPYQIAYTAARLLGEHLRVNRCAYAHAQPDGQSFEVIGDYCDGVPTITGRYPIASFGEEFERLSRSGQPYVVDDIETDPRTEGVRPMFRRLQIRAVVSVPLLEAGRLAGGMAVHQVTPRRWRTDEIDLVRLVAHRCWESITRASLNASLRDSEEHLMQAVGIAELGTFETDFEADAMIVNAPGRAIFGWTNDEPLSFAKVKGHFHPDDSAMATGALETALDPAGPGSFDIEHRIVRTDGAQRWIRIRGRAIFARRHGAVVPVRCLGTYLDVTERREAEERRDILLRKERAARKEAERVIRMKDEFLATLSHELRTPLNAILGWSQLVRRKSVRGEELRAALDTIDRNARAQARLIDDLLDMSRIISGKIHLEIQPVDLAVVVDAARESIQPAADARGVGLHMSIEPQAAPVAGDPARLQQVVWNLLSNAVKFTPPGGRVDVTLSAGDSHVALTVRDTGIGIDPGFLPHIFERFRQQDASPTRAHGGLGLGLSIAKHLVELHGGTVHASCPGEGHGATFVVVLPVLPLASVDRLMAPQADSQTGAFQPSAPPLRGVRVMVVDDDADAREVIQRVLEDAGASVTTAESAEAALDVLRTTRMDVLVSDIGMPEMDGYDLIARVRELPPETASIPAIALTAYARDEDRARALGAGYRAHVAKPLDVEALVGAIAEAVENSRAH